MDISTLGIYIFIFFGLYFQIFMLVTFFEDAWAARKDIGVHGNTSDADLPTVSITVPCFNEARTVESTIHSLLALDYPQDKLSILIVDDGSSDNTFEIAQRLTALSPNIRAVRQQNGGKYTALNRGITESQADFVGCLDADSFVDPSALRRMMPYFKDAAVMAVTPAMRVHNPMNILQRMQRVEYNVGIFSKFIFSKLDAIHVTPGPFSIFRKSVFSKIGAFRHAHNTEDMEIAFRIQEHRYRIANCPNAFVYTVTPHTVRKLYRQRTRWVYGFIKNALDYRRLFFNTKYGNMGLFTLPFAVISVVSVFYIVAHWAYYTTISVMNKIEKISTIGFDWNIGYPSFNWFFMSTEMTTLLVVVLLVVGVTILLLGRKTAEGTMKPTTDMVYFVFLYGMIAPFWLGKAVFNTVLSRKTPWR